MKMKQIALTMALALAAGTFAHAQTSNTVKDDLFAGVEVFAKGASDVTEVTMDPDSLGMVDGKGKTRARQTVLSVVRTYSYDKPGMYRIEDVETFRNKLNTGDWHCSVHTRSLKSGESTDICEKRRTDDLKETAIITVEPKSLTFIHTIRKKSQWDGQSDLVGLGALDGVHLPMLAMLGDDGVPLNLHLNLGRIDLDRFDIDTQMAKMDAEMQAHGRELKMLDSPEMQKRMAEAKERMRRSGEPFRIELLKEKDAEKQKDDAAKAPASKQPE